MKRTVSVVLAVLLVLAMSGAAWAEGGVEVTAGIKTWMNNWKSDAMKKTSDYSLLIGPGVEVEFPNHMFVEASYMMSATDYKFSSDGETMKISRKDADLAVGYMLTHNIGLFAGYRDSSMKEKESGAKATVSGALVGVRGSAPVSGGFSVFGKLSYLFTTLKEESGEETSSEKAPGWVAEAGVKYAFNKQLAASIGYKFEETKTKDTKLKDTFSGATLDVMYTF